MLTGYFEVSVNSNVENRREKFIILISILYPIYSILIWTKNFLCFLRQLLSFLSVVITNLQPLEIYKKRAKEINI